MILSSMALAGALGTLGAVKYRQEKKKKESPWTYAAERLAKKSKKKKGVYLAQQAARLRHDAREFVGDGIAPYVSQTRRQQLAEITVGQEVPEVSEAEKEAKQIFLLASCGVLFWLSALFFMRPYMCLGADHGLSL